MRQACVNVIVAGNRMHLSLTPKPAKGSGKDDPVVILVKRASTELFIAVNGFTETFTVQQGVPVPRATSLMSPAGKCAKRGIMSSNNCNGVS